MTNVSLAQSYLLKARSRLKILQVLLDEGAYSDVVSEAQEIVELALKGNFERLEGNFEPLQLNFEPPESRLFPDPSGSRQTASGG